MDKTQKAVLGVGVIAAAAYLYMSNTNETSGSGGNFGGMGGGEGFTTEGLKGESDGGIPYNISLPAVDTSGVTALFAERPNTGGDSVTTVTESIVSPLTSTKKESVSKDAIEQNGSLSSSLAQVFGTEDQKTNSRGDYYTTPAGGGAGAIKGKSIGESVIGFLSQSYKDSKTEKGKLPTGASTAVKPEYDLSGVNVKSILQADTTKKESQLKAISQTKLKAPTSDKTPDLKTYLAGGGTLKSSNGSTISGKAKSITVSKKEATTKKGGDIHGRSPANEKKKRR